MVSDKNFKTRPADLKRIPLLECYATQELLHQHLPQRCNRLHPPDSLLILIRLQLVKVGPPFEKHSLTDELEPGRKDERLILEHLLQLLWGNVFRVLDFVRVDVKIDLTLEEQDVID